MNNRSIGTLTKKSYKNIIDNIQSNVVNILSDTLNENKAKDISLEVSAMVSEVIETSLKFDPNVKKVSNPEDNRKAYEERKKKAELQGGTPYSVFYKPILERKAIDQGVTLYEVYQKPFKQKKKLLTEQAHAEQLQA